MICVYLYKNEYINYQNYQELYVEANEKGREEREEALEKIKTYNRYKPYAKLYIDYVSPPIVKKSIQKFDSNEITKNQLSYLIFDQSAKGSKFKKHFENIKKEIKRT